jgi:PKD repeat protein
MLRIGVRATGRRRLIAGVATATIAVSALATTATAAPPDNDAIAAAMPIATLPFVVTADLTEATREAAEPSNCGFDGPTVWYRFTPTSNVVLGARATDGAATSVYLEFSPDFLHPLGCTRSVDPVPFIAFTGSSYLIQVGTASDVAGTTELTVEQYPGPPNDDFAQATAFSDVPFSDTIDIAGAGIEPGEPIESCSTFVANSAWYAFTPTVAGVYSARSQADGFLSNADVFTGSSLNELTRVACGGSGQSASWVGQPGQTYYLRLGTQFMAQTASISVDLAAPPTAGYVWSPSSPSIHDTVQFFDTSSDGANLGIESWTWDFGDGTSGQGPAPTHRYAADGDYPVTLSVTTVDGRHAAVTNTISVATHDVRIVALDVPKKAPVGRTETITVRVANNRYAETVQVQLMRSRPTGFETFASSTQLVPVRSNNKTTDFRFSYTFTADDARLDRVTFGAVATIDGHNDALAGDNEALATTTVR